MFDKQHFTQSIAAGYQPKGDYIYLGAAMHRSEDFSEFYDTKDEHKALGIGEALVTALDEKGKTAPLAATMLKGAHEPNG